MIVLLSEIHRYVWPLLVVLFLAALFLPGRKSWGMLLRICYLIVLLSGFWLLAYLHFPILLAVKGVLALILIGLMERTLARRRKKQPFLSSLLLAAIVLVLVLLIGYRVI